MKPRVPRVIRVAILVFPLLALAVNGLLRGRENLALHKPVTMSSVLLGSPAGVVNGAVEWGSYAVHTRGSGASWVLIDLEGTFPIGEVRVFGRGDGYQTDSASPIAIELSVDGRSFAQAGVCETVVTQVSPCRAKPGGTAARFVRLAHPTHLVLSEVEVFGER